MIKVPIWEARYRADVIAHQVGPDGLVLDGIESGEPFACELTVDQVGASKANAAEHSGCTLRRLLEAAVVVELGCHDSFLICLIGRHAEPGKHVIRDRWVSCGRRDVN